MDVQVAVGLQVDAMTGDAATLALGGKVPRLSGQVTLSRNTVLRHPTLLQRDYDPLAAAAM